MAVLHISVLKSVHTLVQEIGTIAQNMPEFDRVEFVNRPDDVQNTPLDYAITTSSSTIVNILVSAGARINDTDRLGQRQERACGVLLRFGADGQYAGILEDDSYDAERNGHTRPTTHGPVEASMSLSRRHSNPSIDSDPASREPDILAGLSPIMHGEASTDDGGIVDGFGTFRRSPIFIFRYGPDFAAKFSAKYADGHDINDGRNLSNFDVRITQLRDSNDRGKHWRYSKDNVLGICGVAFEERKFPDRVYQLRRNVWVKIKWRNIVTADKGLLEGDCSWIPRDDFTRLCGNMNFKRRVPDNGLPHFPGT
ncbi:hypothetical protein N7541_009260 [Penicillium brevicompactum]|uniref:Ankyrin repeat protein n=1 Tax=Penicillium brevicompactum TaxID=5074 RepID=A0A9W9QLJ4_PENBR|nr:hypothetical protein N7541_009260 [Penicillium brevicompactum]